MLYLKDFKILARSGQPVTLEFSEAADQTALLIHTLGKPLAKGIVSTFDEFTMLIAKALKKLEDEETS